jgi:hypothetical protein
LGGTGRCAAAGTAKSARAARRYLMNVALAEPS